MLQKFNGRSGSFGSVGSERSVSKAELDGAGVKVDVEEYDDL